MKNLNAKGGAAYARSVFARAASDTNDVQALSANTVKKYALKAGAKFLEIHTDVSTPIYGRFGLTGVTPAAVPAADDVTGNAVILIRSGHVLAIPDGATHLSLISTPAAVVSIASFGL